MSRSSDQFTEELWAICLDWQSNYLYILWERERETSHRKRRAHTHTCIAYNNAARYNMHVLCYWRAYYKRKLCNRFNINRSNRNYLLIVSVMDGYLNFGVKLFVVFAVTSTSFVCFIGWIVTRRWVCIFCCVYRYLQIDANRIRRSLQSK